MPIIRIPIPQPRGETYQILIHNVFNSAASDHDFIAYFFGLERIYGVKLVCFHCGNFSNDTRWNVINHNRGGEVLAFCSSRCKNHYVFCWHCGRMVPEPEIREHDGRKFCNGCYREYFVPCHGCDTRLFRDDAIHSNATSEFYCANCYSLIHSTCVRCGAGVYNDYTYSFAEDDSRIGDSISYSGPYCERCYHILSSRLHQWDYRPSPIFYGTTSPYYGIEVEVDHFKERNSNAALKFISECDNKEHEFYCKGDGSLGNGFEVVFHPRDIRNWANYGERLSKMSNILISLGGRSFDTNTCGIHVHRSRDDIGIITRSKLIMLFNKLRRHIIKFSQRTSSYASFDVFAPTEGKKLLTYKLLLDGNDTMERYQAINFQPPHTVEFRVFKGTLNVPTLLAYIGFCHYITDFAKVSLMSDIEKKENAEVWYDFCIYMDAKIRKPLAEELISYLIRKNMFIDRPKNAKGVKPCAL